MKRRLLLSAAAAALSLWSVSCGEKPQSSGKPLIVTTTTMITQVVKNLAGDKIEIHALMGAGMDPHSYKPDPGDVAKLRQATILVCSGLHLEGKMTEVLEARAKAGKTVITASDGLPESEIITAEGAHDPHIWGDASLWVKAVDHIADKLAAAMPEHAAQIKERAAAEKASLEEAHAWIKAKAESLPKEKRVLVTSHDAFRYFGRAYGFEVVGVQGISTDTQASLNDRARVGAIIKTRGIKAVFSESIAPNTMIVSIAGDTGAAIAKESLYADAIGAPGETITIDGKPVDIGTVAGMLKANMHTIVEALR